MKSRTLNIIQPYLEIVNNLNNSNVVTVSNALSLMELLTQDKYHMVDGLIAVENYDIFMDRTIRAAFDEFITCNQSGPRPLTAVTVIQQVSHNSCSADFEDIYQNLLANIDNISYFQDKFNVKVNIDIHVEEFDSARALLISNFIVDSQIDYLNFIFDFSPPSKNLASSLISNIKEFCINPVLKNSKIRLINFPFCFIPAPAYKCLYRNIIDQFKGKIFFQQDTLRKLRSRKYAYFKLCRTCRCKLPCYAYTDIQKHPAYKHFLYPKIQDTVVFSGGSLRGNHYSSDNNIVYTSPAEQGDIFMTILEGFKNILIIDGYFYSKFPCTTFEVMLALEKGINVFGSSSIGALRAVELDNYGMIGMGYVYEYLKKQSIKPYHIVAQTYDEYDEPLSIPLVNIIYFLESALAKGIITKNEFEDCLNIADNIHFTYLSFKYFLNQLGSEKESLAKLATRLGTCLSQESEESFDIKMKDAILLLNKFRSTLKNRSQDYVKKAFIQAKRKYSKILYSKYHCDHNLTLPRDWEAQTTEKKASPIHNTRDNREYVAEKTCALAEKFFEDLDVVVADTTKYDRTNTFTINIIFVPFFFLKRSPSSSNGNGDIFQETLTSAYMELIERIPLYKFNINALAHNKINKKPFPHHNLPQYYNWDESPKRKDKIFKNSGYVEATEILSGKNILIPKGIAMSTKSGSDGNASGNSLAEAILYGIYELIERDIAKIYRANIFHNFKSSLSINKSDIQDRRCQTLLEQFKNKGCKIIIQNFPNIYDIPCITCLVCDLNNKIMRHGGTAARSDFNSAVYAALREAYMQYITYFIGTRDDYRSHFNKDMQLRYKQEESMLFNEQNYIPVRPAALQFNSIHEELEYVINKLKNAGMRQIIVINTSPDDKYRLRSVKVIIPKLELIFIPRFKPSPFYREKVNRTVELIRHLKPAIY